MAKNKKTNFAMTPEMQKFQYEVAQEIGLSTDALAKANLGSGKKTSKNK